tara:strand:- start:4320 stop:5192 length:873 start_codon:yes stop_codon:yes gene_type:complete
MIQKITQQLRVIHPQKFSILLSIFFIVLHFESIIESNPIIYLPILTLGSIGILFERSRHSKYYWISITTFYFLFVIQNWQIIDNHIYLWGYWLLAICTSFFTTNQHESLKLSAKYLIAFCMAYAFVQKLNPNFLSGDFFYYKLITDQRFNFIGPLIQYNLSEVISENIYLINKVTYETKTVILNAGPYILHPISKFLTWYTLIIEGILALLFFLKRKKVYIWQHSFLLIFGSLYFVLPIRGFAYALLTMGFVLIKKEDIKLKFIYILYLFYIFLLSSSILNTFLKSIYLN